jgi:hypothetical protein
MAQLRVRLFVLAALVAIVVIVALRVARLDRDQLAIEGGIAAFAIVMLTGWTS